MKKRMTCMIIGLLIVFGGIIVFNVVKNLLMGHYFAHYQPPAVTVSSVTAVSKAWKPTINAVGNFSAINGVNVNSQASGNVVAIHFKSGQFIKANQPLIDIDDSVDQATLKFNQADLALQIINHKRQVDLLTRNATAAAAVDEAQAKLLEAEANVEKTQALIHQKHINSPFAGQLGLREVNLGEYITPGQSTIVTLQSLEPLYVEFYLPEQLLEQLHLGQVIVATLQHYPDLRFAGKITAINSKADTQTHNIKIQATFPNCPTEALADLEHSTLVRIQKIPHNTQTMVFCNSQRNIQNNVSNYTFIPGMFTSLEIEQPPIPNVVVLPSTAISYSLYGNSVFIIEKDKSSEQDSLVVRRVFVSTGEQQGNETRIIKGIEPGQHVVSTGELKLQNGTHVIINNSINLASRAIPHTLTE